MCLYPINRQTSQNPIFGFQRNGDQRLALRQRGELLVQRMHEIPHRMHISNQQRLALQQHDAFRAQGIGDGDLTSARKRLDLRRNAE